MLLALPQEMVQALALALPALPALPEMEPHLPLAIATLELDLDLDLDLDQLVEELEAAELAPAGLETGPVPPPGPVEKNIF